MMVQTETILIQWLAQQCRMIPGVVQAMLLSCAATEGVFDTVLHWPDQESADSDLTPLAQVAMENRKSVLKPRNSTRAQTDEPLDGIACPLYADGRIIGVVAMEIIHRAELMQRAAVQQVQAGGQWLEILLRLGGEEAREQLLNLVDLMAAALEQEHFQVAATQVATLLAQRLNCTQVSLGFLHHNKVQVTALSQTQQIDQQSSFIMAIRDAMGEALDQGARILLPLPEGIDAMQATRFHARLSEMRQGAALCTIPLVKNGKAIGAMLLERPAQAPFDLETLDQSEQIALLLAPVLETKRREERSLRAQVMEKVQHWGQRLFGRGYWQLKLTATVSAALLLWLALADGTQRIVSDSVLEANSSLVIAAPQQGYIAEARVRAGDLVKKGDLLASLDNQELLMEQRKWQSQRAQLLKESRKALAGLDRAEVAILSARLAQADAELHLIEQQLQRTMLRAPFTGLVVKGDLSQALGSPVNSGDVLFELSPTKDYRVVLEVDDRDIGLVAPGQKGQLKLSSLPDQSIPFTVKRLMPVSQAENGRNYFRVEATMQYHSDLMRPGMEGISKIETGQEKLLRIWTRRLVEWLQLFIWNYLP